MKLTTMPALKTIASDVNRHLAAIHASGHMLALGGSEYQALEREARKLIKANAVEGWAALGLLSHLVGDVENTHYNFKNAMRLTGEIEVQCCYAVALANLGLFSQVIPLLSALEKPENGLLSCAIDINAECGRYGRAAELTERWNSLHPENPRDSSCLAAAAALLARANVGQDDLLPALDALGSVLRENRLIFLQEPIVRPVKDEGYEQVFVQYLVACNPSETARLESSIVDKFFDAEIPVYESVIRFGLLSAQHLIEKAAA